MNKTPAVRFNGFTDDWEQRKLKEFGYSEGGTSIESEFSEIGKYKVISIGSYSEDSKYTDQGIRAIESEKTIRRILQQNDLTMILNDKTASGNIIGRVLFIDESNVYVYNQRTEMLRPNQDYYHPKFLYHLLNAPMHRQKIIKQSQGNTQIYVNWSKISETTYMLPKIKEQTNISNLYDQLDNLITSQQHIYEKLVNLKNSMLYKMFPQNGSKVPEIRFAGFTGDWKQRKLSDVSNIYDGVHQTPQYTSRGIMFLSVENIVTLSSQKYISEEAFEKDFKIYPQKGDVLMTRIGDVGTPNVVETFEKLAFYVSLALLKPISINSYFLCYSIQSPYLQKGINDRTLTTAIPQKINKDEIGKVDCLIPTSTKEQEQIGSYFNQLDNLITLQHRKLEKLKQLKQAMLHKMFV